MGDGRIFLKTFRASLLNGDLSNEHNFGRIHLTGQYLQDVQEATEICGDIGDLSAN
jgi:hypothetical protein